MNSCRPNRRDRRLYTLCIYTVVCQHIDNIHSSSPRWTICSQFSLEVPRIQIRPTRLPRGFSSIVVGTVDFQRVREISAWQTSSDIFRVGTPTDWDPGLLKEVLTKWKNFNRVLAWNKWIGLGSLDYRRHGTQMADTPATSLIQPHYRF